MPRKHKGNKMVRQGRQGTPRGAAPGPSSARGPAASGPAAPAAPAATTTTTVRTLAAVAASPAASNSNNNNNTSTAPTKAHQANGRPREAVPSIAVTECREVSQVQNEFRVPTPGFLAPPRRERRSRHRNGAIHPWYFAGMEQLRRKIFTSGADQVTARPPPKLNITVEVALPAPNHGFKDVDPSDHSIQKILDIIAKEHEAKIQMREIDSTVMVSVMTTNRPTAKEVIAKIRENLLYRPGEERVWRSRLLVHPPKGGRNGFTAVLEPKANTTGRRIIAAATKSSKPVDPDDVATTEAEYKKEMTKTLDHMATILRQIPNAMRMTVQFGTVILDEWKKGKTDYNLEEVESLVHRAGPRATAHILNTVDVGAARILGSQLHPKNKGLPESVRAFLDEEMVPTYSLILESKNLQIESTLDPVQGQKVRERGRNQIQDYSFGPLVIHELQKQHRAAEVITVCPESDYDWGIEIRMAAVKQESSASAPFSVWELQNKVKFTGQSAGNGFPGINIHKDFLQNKYIDRVYGKTSWRYELSMRYTLEVNLFHEWQLKNPEGKDSAGPSTTAAVLLYSMDWEAEDMRDRASLPRPWDDSFAKQFLQQRPSDKAPGEDPNQTAEPLDHLLLWVDWILKTLGDATEKSKEIEKMTGKEA